MEAKEHEQDELAAKLRGFGAIGVLSIVAILAGNLLFAPMSAILVLLWVKRSRTPWRDIGYVRPSSWTPTVAVGLVTGAAMKILMKAVVMPLLGADPINLAYRHLVGNSAALPGAVFTMIVVAGFGEETLFRGYLFERLGRLLGRGAPATAAIVLLTSALFGIAHYPEQGLAGVEQATIVGLVLGAIYAATGRIFLPMVVHAAFDLVALAILYWDLEIQVARLVFDRP